MTYHIGAGAKVTGQGGSGLGAMRLAWVRMGAVVAGSGAPRVLGYLLGHLVVWSFGTLLTNLLYT